MITNLANKFDFLENLPRLKALFLLLLRSDEYITSYSIADKLNVSSRTIKSDIQILKEEMATLNIEIVSKRSIGYKLIIEDKEIDTQVRSFFRIYQPATVDSEFDYRVQYILRKLLASREPVRVEEIQSELNITYPLNKELQKVKETLTDYGLILSVKPHLGMEIEGKFFKKVMLTIRMYRYFDKHIFSHFGIEEYEQLFQCEETVKGKVRKVFYKTILKSRIVFSDINAERFLIYLLFFRNQVIQEKVVSLELPENDFDYHLTEEYEVVVELTEKLRNQLEGFEFSEDIIHFLTYIAVISTDLYRFRDCTSENYGSLLDLGEETRNYLLKKLSQYLQIDVFDDYTCLKDLLKIMIPISLKIKLQVSDEIDLRYENTHVIKENLLLHNATKEIFSAFYFDYGYKFSKREEQIIFETFLGMLDRINLQHRKLNLAIIAIEGRLSTQQLKFNLKRHYSEYIERIETKVLYELDALNHPQYDYYLCPNYGKHMNIAYSPIYFAKDDMTEFEYVESIKPIFFKAYDYDKKLPPITFHKEVSCKGGADTLPTKSIKGKETYHKIAVQNIAIYYSLTEEEEFFHIYSVFKHDETLNKYVAVIRVHIDEDKQTLRMLLNMINAIIDNPEKLKRLENENEPSYNFLIT